MPSSDDASLLARVAERNAPLVAAAFRLHREDQVPANSWVVDLDAIAANADVLHAAAAVEGLRTYLMTKQFNRNPFVAAVAMSRGVGPAVAVDAHCALVLGRFGIPVGHVGHLNQIPRRWMDSVIALAPEVFTVFSEDMAHRVAAAARTAGREQPLLLRIGEEGDTFFAGQEGGFGEAGVAEAAARIDAIEGVRVAGVTTFPCVHYNFGEGRASPPRVTGNARTLRRAADAIADALGRPLEQLNMAGNTSSETMPLLARAGATHVEPGHGLLGSTANHLFRGVLPEIPAYVYVSEISHHHGGRAYALGGGLWRQGSESISGELPLQAFVGAPGGPVAATAAIDQIIDYHMVMEGAEGPPVGATVVSSFYSQMQMTRAYVVPVSGIHGGRPTVEGVFDWATNALDDQYRPIECAAVAERVRAVADRYRRAPEPARRPARA